MKRTLKRLALGVLVIVLGLVAVFASAFIGNSPIVDGADLATGVRTVKDGFVSAFILDAGEGAVALVDAGNDHEGHALLAELQRRHLDRDAVRAIFLTHGHPDHIAAVALFPHAEVYALASEVALAEGRVAASSPMGRMRSAHLTGIRVTHPLADGEVVTVGPLRVRAFAIPGHTSGSAAYLAQGVLFLGDSSTASNDGKVRGPVWMFSENSAQDIESLHRLVARLRTESQTVDVLAFAHSGPLRNGLSRLEAVGR